MGYITLPVPSLLLANGQVRSGFVYNWTSWLDDYGFGKCTDLKKCNVFPDGKPFPQSNDWRHKGYVYVWHTMGKGGHTHTHSFFQAHTHTLTLPCTETFLTEILLPSIPPRPVLRDLRWLLLQPDPQHHQHHYGGWDDGGDGIQETRA